MAQSDVNKVVYGRVGMAMAAGEVAITRFGKKTTPFPKFNKLGKSDLTKINAWWLENCINAAKGIDDRHNLMSFSAERADNLSQTSRDWCELYLFGDFSLIERDNINQIIRESSMFEIVKIGFNKNTVLVTMKYGTYPIRFELDDDEVGTQVVLDPDDLEVIVSTFNLQPHQVEDLESKIYDAYLGF